MNKFKNFIIILAFVIIGVSIPLVDAATNTVSQPITLQKQNSAVTYVKVSPLDVVARPNFYLNKNIKIQGKFDKFSTLGLDYKPAMRSSENYITFLIQRPDVTDHNIPLSELKIFLKRTEAEKHIDLNSGDVVEFSGKIFSTALGDPWMDVASFTVISTVPKDDKK